MSKQGPTIYQQLLQGATDEPKRAIAKELHGYLVAVERDISQATYEMLRRAYMEGVRDGFHEGLAAVESPLPVSSAAAREEGGAR